ncbi:hypothetical protein DNU06_08480 [Putridiphycobacter roseus]|uniref:Carboxypeptidase regulatory-like domain-containing protein n=1 Tax=Putridiphycobacter roseus TaxID=2219161 RepID=A0A2W1MZF8_9FLAO|nr:hypothetical protein [Putridiphycobacter roseus]PZE17297.1 hypothetical protein DNU06_08480 [Putridiphycobacter roseus]
MNRFLLKTGLFASFLLIMVIGLKSCKKEDPTTATIAVVDTAGNVVENALVRLYPTPSVNPHPTIIIDDTLYTNFEGKCTFDYTESFNLGQAGFAVLDIEVLMINKTDGEDSLRGTGIIKIVPEEANEESVIIFPV